ncbi:hypothetical protein GE061_005917 [Apolygus lucorum]|uniref:Uncharacterized protein n=1 Tax=Apolygus lucorum TaxID=248454 RepID=A0A8S9WTU9_APOLU|nr:hypothetical protein GE061_005917 [Apolygus lucorum]
MMDKLIGNPLLNLPPGSSQSPSNDISYSIVPQDSATMRTWAVLDDVNQCFGWCSTSSTACLTAVRCDATSGPHPGWESTNTDGMVSTIILCRRPHHKPKQMTRVFVQTAATRAQSTDAYRRSK